MWCHLSCVMPHPLMPSFHEVPTPCHMVPHIAIWCHPCRVVPSPAMWCQFILCHSTSFHVILSHPTTPSHVIPSLLCHAFMSCHPLYCVTLPAAMLLHPICVTTPLPCHGNLSCVMPHPFMSCFHVAPPQPWALSINIPMCPMTQHSIGTYSRMSTISQMPIVPNDPTSK